MNKARVLRTIRRVRVAGAEVFEWEGELLNRVEGRVKTFGRAFADPETVALGHALSIRQSRKLTEILTKAEPARPPRAAGEEASS